MHLAQDQTDLAAGRRRHLEVAHADPVTRRRALLSEMIRIRRVEETIADRYAEQEMRCPVHLSIGQEAVAVGVCAALERHDYAFSTHRAHAHYLAKGGDLYAFLAELYGKDAGCSAGRGGSMHIVDLEANFLGATPILGSSIPVGVGAAFGSFLRGESRVTVIFFGDAATEEGVFAESLNYAALEKLPVVFVCENNMYSVYSSLGVRQPMGRDAANIAAAHGMPALRGDGNDVESVRSTSAAAISRARAGQGPTYLEFATYRWREHCGPNWDNHLGYRTQAEFESWQKRDPILSLERRMRDAGEIDDDFLAELESSVRKEIDAAFDFAKTAPFPSAEDLLTGEYAEPLG